MIDNNKNLLIEVSNIALNAGREIMNYYDSNSNVLAKEDKSPLTEADLASNNIIIEKLRLLNDNIPILSEESLVEWEERKNWNIYWLIDPLDGTKEFLNKNGEFTVNIALIKNTEPILGIIYSPFLSELYFAQKDQGAYKINCSKTIKSLENSVKILSNNKKKSDEIIIIGSRSHSNNKFNEWINQNYKNYKILQKGSSLKFCEIANGNADLYPRFGPTSEWDIAAGHIILEEAGGFLKTFENQSIKYNSKENLINPEFLASCKII
ncbi:3'(2'),5'-bisphosphate nucleotidase CysQ [Alphaproteobacteria bacterium]|nr:3'(2'),5'-bisphosphate nucleotidase CysQ [Alphaproteobacteria bacterium]